MLTLAPVVCSIAAVSNVSFAPLAEHHGRLELPWMNGEPQVSADRSPRGSGELFGFGWSDKLYLYKSGDRGKTWSFVNPTAREVIGNSRLIGATQDSTGRAHLLFVDGRAGLVRYARVALEHTGGAITGFRSEVKDVAVPGAYNTNNDVRGYVLPVLDVSGSEVLVFGLTDNPNTSVHFRLQVGKTASLTPQRTADFTRLDGAAGATVAFEAGFSNHDHGALFAQLGATRDLWFFWGPIDAEFGAPDPTFLTRLRLKATRPRGWSVGAPVQLVGSDARSSPELLAVVGTRGFVWVQYLHPAKGLSFDRVAADGTYTAAAVPSPDPTPHRNGWAVFSVAEDERRIWTIWSTITGSSGDPQTRRGYWDGAKWTTFADAPPYVGDSWGMAGSCGWREGVVAVRLDGASYAIQLSTISAPPDTGQASRPEPIGDSALERVSGGSNTP